MLAFRVELPLGLAVIYVAAIMIWYELLRQAITSRVAKRRSRRARRDEFERWRRQEQEREQAARESAERAAVAESEPDPARRHYYLARKTARAERDAAVEAANEAVKAALERIERRHREIEAALDREESDRIEAQLGRPRPGR